MGDRKGAYRSLVGRNEGKRLLGKLRRRCENYIKWLFKTSAGKMVWIDLVQNRYRWPAVVNAVINLRVP
jgi:hypothetical protein